MRIIYNIKHKLRKSEKQSNLLIASTNDNQNQFITNHIDLIEYLSHYENYKKLSLFLDERLALECLTFIASVIVFRHVLLRLSSIDQKTIILNTSEDTCGFSNRLFGLPFEYLHHLHKEYEMNINNNEINKLVSEIYSKYIDTDGNSSINISGQVRNEIISYFTLDKYGNYKANIDDNLTHVYLKLFNKAVEEIYDPLSALYDGYVNCI